MAPAPLDAIPDEVEYRNVGGTFEVSEGKQLPSAVGGSGMAAGLQRESIHKRCEVCLREGGRGTQ